jgi:7,8-dihydropterin-6-yl-methyl-4-(beta-D-ribofuranosyl)aminobenzene 5'-phosphate synthase
MISLEPVAALTVTTLVDNVADLLLTDEGPAKRYVRRLTSEDRIHAVIGGFHLSGPLFELIIPPTCDALAELAPDYLVPSHCTGWRAIHALAARFPDAFIQNSVGTRFEFTA